MYLKSIEIHGFKSFANKTILKFHKGITGIVGPNGSGKSNVADAVRWVLGEQSAKQLRGAKMEDVIFSGTESRKPLGFAYVAITLDNSDRKLNIDYDQVTVARRVYRSGESEYLMNGSACRLKDVQELFFDTGIGKEGYSIIGQGQVDKILNGKPEERRELFDEAVGIVKYKKRKALTEKNLEAEQQNLYRINDILSELEKQVGPLERQSQKAIEKTKEEYDRLELLNEKYEAKLEVTREALSERRLCKEKLEGEIKVYEGQMASAHETAGHFNSRLESIQNSIKDKKADKKQQIDDKKIVDADIQRLSKDKDDAEGELKLVSGSILALRESIDANNGDMILYMNQAAAIKTKMQRLDTMVEQINIRRSELNQRLIRIQSDEDSGKALLEEYNGIVGGLIIGQAAVDANIVSPIVVIIVALTALCAFTIPNDSFASAFRLIKFYLIFLSAVLGMLGLVAGIISVLVHLCGLKSFGIPYMMPYVSVSVNNSNDKEDGILRVPLFKMIMRPVFANKSQKKRLKMKNQGKE